MAIGVYRIVTPSGKYYVGMTMDSFERRWSGHHKELKRGVHKSTGLSNAYGKYGWEAFEFEILESWENSAASESLVLQREQYWWDYFNAHGDKPLHGRPTGTGSVFHTEQSRKALVATLEAKFLEKHGVTIEQTGRDSRGRLKIKKICHNVVCKTEYLASTRDKYCSRECSLVDPNKQYGPAKKPRAEMKAIILALREEGLSWREVSDQVGISTRSVRKHVNEY